MSTTAVNEEIQMEYIKNKLISEINSNFKNEEPIKYEIERATGLDGFMSVLYNLKLQTKTYNGDVKERLLLLKLMRGDHKFRESSNSYTQCANEVYVYAKVLPCYAEILAAAHIDDIRVDSWTPKSYKAQFGFIDGLSKTTEDKESVLVLEHLKPLGYKLCPRLELTLHEIFLMVKPLAQYHALSYALRLIDAAKFEELKEGINPLYFHRDEPEYLKRNVFRVLHGLGFERFFDYFDRKLVKQMDDTLKIKKRLEILREKYANVPTRLLEHLRVSINDNEEDKYFGTILHGDFNRNNVLFHYEDTDAGLADDAKMIDFQELRYASSAIDLSFFMYMNTPAGKRSEWWMGILEVYHKHMFNTLQHVLTAHHKLVKPLPTLIAYLEHYTFDKFYAHYSKYAFYGVIICMHYLPWLLCRKEECELLTEWFEKDMHSNEFRRISLDAGGDRANAQIFEVIQHACEMGYMDNL